MELKKHFKNKTKISTFLIAAATYDGDDCLNWPFTRSWGGYALYRGNNASRFICKVVHGEPEEGMEAAHSCNNPLCVNPRHIRWATPKENSDDKRKSGTMARLRGSRNGHAKLVEADALAIRALFGKKPTSEIASDFGVSQMTVYSIAARRNWGWLQ